MLPGALFAAVFGAALASVAVAVAGHDFPAPASSVTPANARPTTRLRDPAWLARVYPDAAAGPVWFAGGSPRPAVAAALEALRLAEVQGLRPGDYEPERLERALQAATASREDHEARRRADVALTTAMLRFLSDVSFGRVRAQDVEPDFRPPPREARFVDRLRDAAAEDRIAALIAASEPALPLYARLKEQLVRYRNLAATPAAALPPPTTARSKIVAGDSYSGVPALFARLLRLGDLPPDATRPTSDRYTGDLAEGVRRFQARHGLAQDGVIGRQTLAALNTPLDSRVTQIELALERLRWLPELGAGRAIAINVPSFRLWAFDDARDTGRAALSMPVIVGKALRNETPVFIGEMRAVEFSPYWNVPRTILANELLPRVARDPAYFAREEMELVSTRGDGRVVDVLDAASLEALRVGSLRLRQRPGPKNALGGVKFVLPNTMEIYLHGTPARELFGRTRRDFSHGCIRVRDPEALAAFVLRGKPEWTAETIAEAMTSGRNRFVSLDAPIPVVVFYTTAIVDRAGEAIFLPDVYGHDRKLAAALGSRDRAPPAPARGARPRASPTALPAPHATGVEMHEAGFGVEAHPARLERQRRVAKIRKRDIGQPHVDRPAFQVKAAAGHAPTVAVQRLVGGG
jgi:murein L,D-transpeptidase YcbB/YkuD